MDLAGGSLPFNGRLLLGQEIRLNALLLVSKALTKVSLALRAVHLLLLVSFCPWN